MVVVEVDCSWDMDNAVSIQCQARRMQMVSDGHEGIENTGTIWCQQCDHEQTVTDCHVYAWKISAPPCKNGETEQVISFSLVEYKLRKVSRARTSTNEEKACCIIIQLNDY